MGSTKRGGKGEVLSKSTMMIYNIFVISTLWKGRDRGEPVVIGDYGSLLFCLPASLWG